MALVILGDNDAKKDDVDVDITMNQEEQAMSSSNVRTHDDDSPGGVASPPGVIEYSARSAWPPGATTILVLVAVLITLCLI
jgi:hypothetical protein